MTLPTTHHACAVRIGNDGILIQGTSGSGKTSLALGLVERGKAENLQASLVADDRTYLEQNNKTLVASAPEILKGKVELRGFGITSLPHEAETSISLVVGLAPDETIERMPEQRFIEIAGISLPYLEVPERHENQAVRIIFAWLNHNSDLQLT